MVPVHRDAKADDPRALVTVPQNAVSSIPTVGIPTPPTHLDRQSIGAGIPGPFLTRRSADANWRDITVAWRWCASLLFGCGQRLREVHPRLFVSIRVPTSRGQPQSDEPAQHPTGHGRPECAASQ